MWFRRREKITPTHAIQRAFAAAPFREHSGLELARAAGVRSGTHHPVLAYLEQDGWITSRWEELDPAAEPRPRRRLYRLTDKGGDALSRHLDLQDLLLEAGYPVRTTTHSGPPPWSGGGPPEPGDAGVASRSHRTGVGQGARRARPRLTLRGWWRR